jgi:hypothetical protein
MAKYEATYSFNVRRFIKREIEADTAEEAERIAKADAWRAIDAEIVTIQNGAGFADTEPLDPHLFLDSADGEEICDEALQDPEQPPERFDYSRWRHGGWYVHNVTYPTGACGCVSNNYEDRKWRIACDLRPFDKQPTFKNRDEAAKAEWLLAREQTRRVEQLFSRLDKGDLCEEAALAGLLRIIGPYESSAAAMLKAHKASEAA